MSNTPSAPVNHALVIPKARIDKLNLGTDSWQVNRVRPPIANIVNRRVEHTTLFIAIRNGALAISTFATQAWGRLRGSDFVIHTPYKQHVRKVAGRKFCRSPIYVLEFDTRFHMVCQLELIKVDVYQKLPPHAHVPIFETAEIFENRRRRDLG
jgi:hypothetical protein